MDPADRRRLVLEAATRAFARTGYSGTSTHAVAREASISQPYVVRMFGSKLAPFLEVLDHSTNQIVEALADACDQQATNRHNDEDKKQLGRTVGVVHEPMLVFIQGCSAAHEPAIAAATRQSASQIFQTLRRTGWTDDEAPGLIARHLLASVLQAIRAPDHIDQGHAIGALTQDWV